MENTEKAVEPFLKVQNVCKEFPGVKALDNVSFDLCKGEVHVLIGENGAGKSTLMKVLSGVYQQDSGEIYLNGKKVEFQNTRDAQLARIAIIFQEFNLVPNLTVAQNIFLGREPVSSRGVLDRKKLNADAQAILDSLNTGISATDKVELLGVAHQQLVELAKALSFDSEILIMDEPTATLSENEINTLFDTIFRLKARGVSIIYISHRLHEVYKIGDRITVLRDGQTVGTRLVSEASMDELIRLMVGREIQRERIREENTVQESMALEVRGLWDRKLLQDISINVRRGEIVGIAGLVGSGRTELAQTIFGIKRRSKGYIALFGRELEKSSPGKCVMRKAGFLPENRKEQGLSLNLPIRTNIVHAALSMLFPMGIVRRKKEKDIAENYRKRLRIITPDTKRNVSNLSGGNQQKVVLAKWLATESDFLIFDEPTRGVDVGAKEEIHFLIDDLARNGKGILVISSDLPELLTIADRIYVMREGRIVKEFKDSHVTQEEIIAFAAGGVVA
ncbi:MAG: sugar ABC transporter ATP-binding protein [Eubacteriales bacterium]|nr:sugar ABC transporter ATP-binding protein [Eubacteriales bacterium]